MTTPPTLIVCLPRRWHRRHEPAPGVLVAARAAQTSRGARPPEITVRATPVDVTLEHGTAARRRWREQALADLARELVDLEVEDDDLYDDHAGRPVLYHRFGHREGGREVVCEQWSWVVDGWGLTLTGVVAREDYAELADVLEAVAGTVEISTPAAPPWAA